MYAIEVGDERERESWILIRKSKMKAEGGKNETSNFVWECRVVQPTHSKQRQLLGSLKASAQSQKDTYKEPKAVKG